MKENPLKTKLRAGGSVVGTMVSGFKPTAVLAQYAAVAGFDFAMISMEHTAYALQDVHEFCQMARQVGVTPLVRVPDLTYQWVAQVLDIGVMGVMAPRMQDSTQAREFVSYVRFLPQGIRGWGGEGRTEHGLAAGAMPDVIKRLDAETLVIAQIEAASAIADIDAIAAIDGIDVCLIGPMDLSIAVGTPGDTHSAPFIAAVQKMVDACQRHGKVASAHFGSLEDISYWAERGMRMLMCQNDTMQVNAGWARLAKDLKSIAGR